MNIEHIIQSSTWDKLTSQHRYAAQDFSGLWYLYTVKPRFGAGDRWIADNSPNYVQILSSDLLPNYNTLVIDIYD